MHVREYQENDLAQQGFEYALPDLGNPLFLTKPVLTQGDASSYSHDYSPLNASASKRQAEERTGAGNCDIVGAALLRLKAEAYLLLDPRAGTPRERWQGLMGLHAAAERDAWSFGLEDVHAWSFRGPHALKDSVAD